MAARETLDQWADALDAIGELYCHVIDTVSDLPEPKTDLAGTTSKGAPPPLPGGMKLVLAGPHNLHAPPDDTAHPGVFLEKWCGHVGRRSRSIPPTRTRALSVWQARLLWLRERLQWIEAEETFNAEIRAVHGLLRSVTNVGRLALGEERHARLLRAHRAHQELRARIDEVPSWTLIDRVQAGIIWPVFRSPADRDAIMEAEGGMGAAQRSRDASEDVEGHDRAIAAWKTVRERANRFRDSGDDIGFGKAPFSAARAAAEALSVTNP